MDRHAITLRSELECMIFDESTKPKALPLSLLQDITSDFSIDQVIAFGGFSVVYKGMLGNGIVAVKKLSENFSIDEKKFSGEIHCLMKAKHKNIVRLLGYCSNVQGEMLNYEGKLVLADVRERLLCFEYLPKGSLDKKITDASCGLAWRQRYQIIVGICDGLYYLHQKGIVHLDLKPGNILLDAYMVPKIADFGLSRFFDEKQSQAIASKVIGTIGYLAPEFFGSRQITFKLDIYSLGMIIMEIVTGEKGYADIDNVLESWRNRLEKSQVDTQLVQVRACTEIAIECTDFNPAKRPDTQDIINRLGATKSADEFATETGASISSATQLAAVPLGPTIGPENAIANPWKRSRKELYNMTDQDLCFSSTPVNSSNAQQITDICETTLDPEEPLIIGRNEETQKIMATLSRNIIPDITVHPIYGFGDGIAEKHEVENGEINTHLIEQITKVFSEEEKIGSDWYGEVYKAVYNGEAIAVKKLYNMQAIDDKEFKNEFCKLMKVKHRNIVQLIGYCHGIQHRFVKINGELLFAKTIDRLLCSEYMEDGSLANHLSDESCGFDWPTRYRIIKGICDGLNHLHNEQNDFIYHLNLNPNNIFLDKNMRPKIADFGMYRLLASSNTHITQIVKGTLGYMPPEFIDKCRITEKYDVFSVGVIIIQIMAGSEGYKNCCEMSSPQFIELVQQNWKHRLQRIPMQENAYTTDILAVQRCIELAVRCVGAEPVKRPSIMEVVDELDKLDADIEKISHRDQGTCGSRYPLVDPEVELRIPFQLYRDMFSCVQLTNTSDKFIAFNIKSNRVKYMARPNRGTMPPCSTSFITIKLQAQVKEPPHMRCHDMLVVQSAELGMESSDEITDEFFEKAAESMAVDVVRLPIVLITMS